MRSELRRIAGTIRAHSLLVVGALAFVPLLFVLGTPTYQNLVRNQLETSAREAATRAATVASAADIAREHGVRLRLVEPDGDVGYDHGDAIRGRWQHHVALRFVGDEEREAIRDFDADLASVSERSEVIAARKGRVATGCSTLEDESILSCHHVVPTAEGGAVHAQAAAVQTVSRLYGERFPIIALVLQTLLVALLLGWWLSRRTVRPIDRLRREVNERTQAPVSTEPVPVTGNDEVAELGRSFNELLEALRAQRHANMDFLAEVAHELKTPIATIQQFAELVRDSDDPTMERALGGVERSVQRLNARVDELMELARAEAGLPQETRTRVRLDEMIGNLVEGYAGDLHFDDIEFVCDLRAVEFEVSERHFEIALRNLIENAAQHADERVTVELLRDADDVILRIRDDGPGIPDDELEHVFDRFYSKREAGTGLGLPMASAVIRAHDGSVTLANCSDGGAVVDVRLPGPPHRD